MTNELLNDIAALADELTDPRQHVERIYGWTPTRNKTLIKENTTIQQGLLQQLRDAIHTPANPDKQGRKMMPASKPPLQLEALGRLIDIEIGTNQWIHETRQPHRGNLESNIRGLVGAATRLDNSQQHQLLADLRRWRSWAAVLSGWATPPYQPHVTCPIVDCAELGTIRIILERKTGLCVACQTIWDERDGSINLLAAHIAAETNQPHERVPVGSTVSGHGGWTERRTS